MTDKAATESHFRITVTIDGEDAGIWDKKEGGNQTAEVTKHRPGGSPSQTTALPGPVAWEDVTVTRSYVGSRDKPISRALIRRAGRAAMQVSIQDLDADLNVYGRITTITGTLMTVQEPNVDSDSSAVAMLGLVMSVETVT